MAVEFTQTDFRFRNDDGTHATATWKANANVNISVDVSGGNVKLRVRLAAQEVGTTAATFAANLFMSKNGGAYAQVSDVTSSVKAVDSANLTDNATTTQQITAFTYVTGRVDDVNGTITSTASIVQNSGTEFEFMVELIAADLANGDTLDFRLYRSSVAIANYTNTARITIINNPPIATLELPPGLRFVGTEIFARATTYERIELPASKQVISLDSLPRGKSFLADFPSPILWDEFSLMHWDDGSVIEWDHATHAPQVVELKR